jgi:hypothetical protein
VRVRIRVAVGVRARVRVRVNTGTKFQLAKNELQYSTGRLCIVQDIGNENGYSPSSRVASYCSIYQ